MNDANKLVLQGSDNFLAMWKLIKLFGEIKFWLLLFHAAGLVSLQQPSYQTKCHAGTPSKKYHLQVIQVSYFAHNKLKRSKYFPLDNW